MFTAPTPIVLPNCNPYVCSQTPLKSALCQLAICRSVTRGPCNENSDSYSGAPDQTTIIYLCIVYIRYCASVRLWSEIKFTLLYFTIPSFYLRNISLSLSLLKAYYLIPFLPPLGIFTTPSPFRNIHYPFPL